MCIIIIIIIITLIRTAKNNKTTIYKWHRNAARVTTRAPYKQSNNLCIYASAAVQMIYKSYWVDLADGETAGLDTACFACWILPLRGGTAFGVSFCDKQTQLINICTLHTLQSLANSSTSPGSVNYGYGPWSITNTDRNSTHHLVCVHHTTHSNIKWPEKHFLWLYPLFLIFPWHFQIHWIVWVYQVGSHPEWLWKAYRLSKQYRKVHKNCTGIVY